MHKSNDDNPSGPEGQKQPEKKENWLQLAGRKVGGATLLILALWCVLMAFFYPPWRIFENRFLGGILAATGFLIGMFGFSLFSGTPFTFFSDIQKAIGDLGKKPAGEKRKSNNRDRRKENRPPTPAELELTYQKLINGGIVAMVVGGIAFLFLYASNQDWGFDLVIKRDFRIGLFWPAAVVVGGAWAFVHGKLARNQLEDGDS